MQPTLKELIEDGERILAEVEDPAKRVELRAKMFNNLLAKFPQLQQGLIEMDGALLEPVSRKDVEDQIIQDHHDREDSATASDMVEERDGEITGCYGDDEGDSEPKIRGMMAGPNTKYWGQTFRGVTYDIVHSGLLAHDFEAGNLRTGTDSDGLGAIYVEQIGEEMGGGHHQRSLHTRYGGGIADGRETPKKDFARGCVLCKRKFAGTENAKYCDECKSPKYAHMRRQQREEDVPEISTQPPTPIEKTCLICKKKFEGQGSAKYCDECAAEFALMLK